MVIIMSPHATGQDIAAVIERIESAGLKVHLSRGEERTIIGAIGDVRKLDPESLQVLPSVERVVRILHPFKLASRDFSPESTVVNVKGIPVGSRSIVVAAGPCSVENRDMMMQTASIVARANGTMLRGGAFKPRTSPYAFQGLGLEGLKILREAADAFDLPVVTEVLSPEQVDLVSRYADVLQIGTRNMQNFALLHAVGKSGMPVLLKRGMMSSIEEWLQAAEYILSEGNPNVILCERGIRTFETATRNTLDLSAVPVVKKLSHLPVWVDPSHGTGRWDIVTPMAKAAIAAGADGLLIEVHPAPERALSDGPQSLKPAVFEDLMRELQSLALALGREIYPRRRTSEAKSNASEAKSNESSE
ncbi:MAG TPA: 3-deoxy-7-phosphoheptulonate synthase [Clostridia bacterium]|nr:3-deoxy-7-phosphoheptulonate synthase [Clostridia bacterium]